MTFYDNAEAPVTIVVEVLEQLLRDVKSNGLIRCDWKRSRDYDYRTRIVGGTGTKITLDGRRWHASVEIEHDPGYIPANQAKDWAVSG